MKTLSLRGLSRDAPILDEAVLVTHDNQVIGRFIPIALDAASSYVSPVDRIEAGFNTRPFTPAPKPGTKKK